jgi:hypothetical protein
MWVLQDRWPAISLHKTSVFCNGRESEQNRNYTAYSSSAPCFGLFQVLIVYNVSNINDIIEDSNSVIQKLTFTLQEEDSNRSNFLDSSLFGLRSSPYF